MPDPVIPKTADLEFDWFICDCGCDGLRAAVIVGEHSKSLDVWLYHHGRLFLMYLHDRPEPGENCASNFYSLRGAEDLIRGWIAAARGEPPWLPKKP